MTGTRLRLVVFAVVVVLAAGGAIAYVTHVRQREAAAKANEPAVPTRADLASVAAVPHLVFRSTNTGTGYGQVALTPLADPDGPRAFTAALCERVYAVASVAICLAARRGLATTYHAQVMSPQWTAQREAPLPGLPSRARLSGDGTLTATTTFVHGDSYTNPGQFSTRTVVGRVSAGGVEADLEQFTLTVDGRTISAADRNLWGVTFADDDRFYATAASGKRTWLVEGSLSGRRMNAIREDVECPSLSPDGSRIAFKRHGNLPAGQWRLAVFDLKTRQETVLAEARSVDDQAVWLDEHTVLYGLPRGGATATSDVWAVPADGTGSPNVLVHDAWSPSVVR